MKFTLEIKLGNAEMQEDRDIAAALNDVASRVFMGQTEGAIRDINGNTVGSFELTE